MRRLTLGEEILCGAWEGLGYRRACDRVREWGEAHRGRLALLAPEQIAAQIEAWLREQEGLQERGERRAIVVSLEPQAEVRAEVRAFAQIMERKLRKHDDWPGWQGCDPWRLFDALCDHAAKLSFHLSGSADAVAIAEAAADCANFAMMIADVAGGLDTERGTAGAGERDRGELAVAAGEAAQGLGTHPAAMWPGASTDRGRADEGEDHA